MVTEDSDRGEQGVAIVGVALRVPGARSTDEFWRNLSAGVESIRDLSDEELSRAGVPSADYRNPRYVRRKGVLDGADEFDARFFELTPLEASVMDPQHRLFLECAWEALENAGYGGSERGGRVGVYTGVGINTYWLRYVATNARAMDLLGGWQASILNDKDFVPTRVSYHLDLKGPSVSVNSACSASLVAVHVACQSLLTYESDMALAGGVSVEFPQQQGVLWREGMVYAPDGHCRAFDAEGGGIVDGSGVGIVVLKRLADALRDGDSIRGVILGSAVNNDGAAKVGYTAPSIEGQVDVIRQALAMAGCRAEDIGYVEAHGTATALGDPIEVAALTQAFRDSTDKTHFCALGSVKSNLGHLDTAAGVAGLIKTLLCLEHAAFVPSLHYRTPNPHIDFESSPFYVSTEHRPWPRGVLPRRAGVTSLGIGGTNAHVIVEEPPLAEPSESHRELCLFPLSGKTEAAVGAIGANLAAALQTALPVGRAGLSDVAYTLQVGRRPFEYRRAIVAGTAEELRAALAEAQVGPSSRAFETPPPVVFLFPGQGAQHPQMTRELYASEPVYRRELDRCAELLRSRLDIDPRAFIFSTEPGSEDALCETAVAQPALFSVEYALARLWSSWGIEPDAMLGHSVGELVAACLSGVFELEDALAVVAARGALMAQAPKGAMLAVNLPASALADRLFGGLAIAAINEPDASVASGPVEAVAELERRLSAAAIEHRRLRTSHAFHSSALDGIVEPFVREVARVKLSPPRKPLLSNLTGTYMTPEQATSPGYWGQHLRQTVRFSQGLGTLLADGAPRTFLEVGPGQVLSRMVKRHPQRTEAVAVLASLPPPQAGGSERRSVLEALGALWRRGHAVDWTGFHAHEKLRRVPLPPYPFERRRHWLDAAAGDGLQARAAERAEAEPARDEPALAVGAHVTVPSWIRRTPPVVPPLDAAERWLLILDRHGCGEALAARLRAAGGDVVVARPGSAFDARDARNLAFDPARPDDLARLLETLQSRGVTPQHGVHLAGLDGTRERGEAERWQSFAGLAALLGAAERLSLPPARWTVVTSRGHSVTGEEVPSPESAAAYGLVRAAGLERPGMLCRSVDVSERELERLPWLAERLSVELRASSPALVAYRGQHRWEMTFETLADASEPAGPGFRPTGRYVVVGGLDGPGAAVARHLSDGLGAATVRIDDDGDLAARLREAEARLGGLDGVVYAAVRDEPCLIGAIGALRVDAVTDALARRERELLALEDALHGRALDFCVVFSSLSSVVGGAGFGAYAARHLLGDAVVRRHNQRGEPPWTSVNFDRWLEGPSRPRQEGLPAEQALRALEGLVRHPEREQVIVAAGDLSARIQRSCGPSGAVGGVEAGLSRAGLGSGLHADADHLGGAAAAAPLAAALDDRPLSTPYTGPRDEAERSMAAIWQELLGIGRIGIEDDFFDLGGHSLLATRFLVRLEERLGLRISIADFFSHPTVAELAELCRDAELARAGSAELEHLLTQMEEMSETEAHAELQTVSALELARELESSRTI